jgi:hypothetical protein
MQCRKCQRIGHAAVNCNLQYRCVKCNSEHKPGEGENISKNSKDLFCVNCNSLGHPASYRGCPIIKEIKKKINDKKNIHTKENHISYKSNASLVKPGMSFAEAVSENKQLISNKISSNIKSTDSTVNIGGLNPNHNINTLNNNDLANFSNLYQLSLRRLSIVEKSVEDIFNFINNLNEKLDKFLSVING